MDEKNTGISRRNFAKGVGLGVAALSFAGAKVANASLAVPQDEFNFAVKNMFPMKSQNSQLVIGRKKIKFYKDQSRLYVDKCIELNGCAGLIAQVCNGTYNCETILQGTADIYGVPHESIRDNVYEFLRFLFYEGYICFVSNNLLSKSEKRKGKGLIVREKNDPLPKVLVDIKKKYK